MGEGCKWGSSFSSSFFFVETIELERFMPRIPPLYASVSLKQLKQCGGLISEAGQIKITAFDCAALSFFSALFLPDRCLCPGEVGGMVVVVGVTSSSSPSSSLGLFC